MRNLHKYFYKDYFGSIGFVVRTDEKGKEKMQENSVSRLNNTPLLEARFSSERLPNNQFVKHTFTLVTMYPGLITGVGIEHEAGIEGEFKLGMHFDFTRGVPIIYGSSVKGVLRSYFCDFAQDLANTILGENTLDAKKKEFLKALEEDIFCGKDSSGENKFKPMAKRDVFFDGVICGAKKEMLASDTLCPHGDNPLKNPTPITFVKIAPEVQIQFRFKLVPSVVAGKTISADQKKELFEEILRTVGIGAKTNVGYGQFK